MKIVLLEPLAVSEEKVAALAAPLIAAGHSFVAYTDGARDVDLLIERAKDADILMVASSPLPAEVVDACKNLKLISVAFTGVDHLPMALCRERGILVSNCAGYSNESVAELVFGLVISLLRRIPACDTPAAMEKPKRGLSALSWRARPLVLSERARSGCGSPNWPRRSAAGWSGTAAAAVRRRRQWGWNTSALTS